MSFMLDKNLDLRKIVIKKLSEPEDLHRWNNLVKEEHYLKNSTLVGEQMRYIAEYMGQWVACLGYSGGALKLSLRSNWTGWTPVQEKQRRHLVIQNSRFLILKGISTPNLASRCLSLVSKRISSDWEATYGHPIYLLETFVESDRDGTCYKACGWEELGLTKGFRRKSDNYERHNIKRRYFVRPLRRDAKELLGADKTNHDKPIDSLKLDEMPLHSTNGGKTIHDILKKYFSRPKKKNNQGGGYRPELTVALVLAGFVSGIKDPENVAAWAKELDDKFKERLGCPYKAKKGVFGYQTPSANTIRYTLQDIDPILLEKGMSEWASLCGINTDRTTLALDGKVLRGAKTESHRAPNHVTLYDVKSGTVVDQELVPDKTSEVTVARDIFERCDLSESLVTADAAHTNIETADAILKKKDISCSPSKTINLCFSTPSKGPSNLRNPRK